MKIRIIILSLLACLCAVPAMAQEPQADPQAEALEVAPAPKKRPTLERMPMGAVFMPKGQLLAGASIGYSSEQLNNIDFLILKNMEANGYSFNLAPYFGYFVADNVAIGTRFKYNRALFNLGNLELGLSEDMNINLKDLYYLNHKYEGMLFCRYYMSIAGSKMFGMFAEVGLDYTYSEGKNSTGRGESLDGTYQNTHSAAFYVNPGLCVFLTNFTAVELSLGILSVDYSWKSTLANQVDPGYVKGFGANFKINPLAINVGVSFVF